MLLAPVSAAGGSIWPATPQCERAVDESGYVVQVCIGGSICYAVGGMTHVFVCVDPSFCPPGTESHAPAGTCRAPGDVDMDGDGWTVAQGDCDDGDPMTYPGAPDDHPDGMDNDCDGSVDEDMDMDGDGFTVGAGDCNDWDSSIYPGAPENPNNGMDDDCDGIVDE